MARNLTLTANQEYHVNGRTYEVQLNPNGSPATATATIWVKVSSFTFHRYEAAHRYDRWTLTDGPSNPRAWDEIQSWLYGVGHTLCNGTY